MTPAIDDEPDRGREEVVDVADPDHHLEAKPGAELPVANGPREQLGAVQSQAMLRRALSKPPLRASESWRLVGWESATWWVPGWDAGEVGEVRKDDEHARRLVELLSQSAP